MKEKRGFESCWRGASKFMAPSFPIAPHQEIPRQLLSSALHCFSQTRATSILIESYITPVTSAPLLVYQIIWSLRSHILIHHCTFISPQLRSALFWFTFLAISFLFLPVLFFPILFLPVIQSIVHQFPAFCYTSSPCLLHFQILMPHK